MRPEGQRLVAVNVPDLSPADETFIDPPTNTPIHWQRLSGLPANRIESGIRGIRLSRYRAAMQAAWSTRSGCFVISHLPGMTAAVSLAMKSMSRRAPHLAFSFNFTDLPSGWRLKYFRENLKNIDQFAIFSTFEREVYSRHFDIDPDRFAPLLWSQSAPPVAAVPAKPRDRPYLCAIGGEGRDFALIFDVARKFQNVEFVVIARPYSLTGMSVPDNVTVMINVPLAQVWRIATESLGVLIPLRSHDTCCGHITLVSAKQLGIPCATTFSHATREYVEGRRGVLESEPGDRRGYALLMEKLIDENVLLKNICRADRRGEVSLHERKNWTPYIDRFVTSHVENYA